MAFTAQDVKVLREKTGVGMMELLTFFVKEVLQLLRRRQAELQQKEQLSLTQTKLQRLQFFLKLTQKQTSLVKTKNSRNLVLMLQKQLQLTNQLQLKLLLTSALLAQTEQLQKDLMTLFLLLAKTLKSVVLKSSKVTL